MDTKFFHQLPEILIFRLTEITSLPEDMSLVDDLTNGTNGDVNENPQTSSSTNTDAPVTSASVEVTSNGSCDEVSDQSAAPTQEDLKGMWRSRWKQSISRKIPGGKWRFGAGPSKLLCENRLGLVRGPLQLDDSLAVVVLLLSFDKNIIY